MVSARYQDAGSQETGTPGDRRGPVSRMHALRDVCGISTRTKVEYVENDSVELYESAASFDTLCYEDGQSSKVN